MSEFTEVTRISITDLWKIIDELLRMRKKVDELQTDNTRLYLEN